MNYVYFYIFVDAHETGEEIRKKVSGMIAEAYQPDKILNEEVFSENTRGYLNEMEAGTRTAIVALETTADKQWKHCIMVDSYHLDHPVFGPYPDLKLSELLHARHGWNCICDRSDLFTDIDPENPYWNVCLQDGKWYACDLGGAVLMGPYTNGETEDAGTQGVKLPYVLGDVGFAFEKGVFSLEGLKEAKR